MSPTPSTTSYVNSQDDLDRLAGAIRDHHIAVGRAAADVLSHALDAGDGLIEAQKKVNHGDWTNWLKRRGLNDRTAQVYAQLARGREKLAKAQHAADLSLRAALRLLNQSTAKPTPKPRSKTPLSLAAWLTATSEERCRFIESVGLVSLISALPLAMRDDLVRRVVGQRTASTSKLTDTLTKSLRTALSLQSAAHNKDALAPGVVGALNGILNKLAAEGLDLHDVDIVVPNAPKRAAA